jgi:hypothetical protein
VRHSLTSFTLGPRLHLSLLIASNVSPGLCCANSLELALNALELARAQTCQTHIFMQLTSSSSTALLASCAASAASAVLGLNAPLQRPRPANQSAGVSPRKQNAVSDAARAQSILAHGCSALLLGPFHRALRTRARHVRAGGHAIRALDGCGGSSYSCCPGRQ